MQMSFQAMNEDKEKEVAAVIGSMVKALECAICLRIPNDPVSIGCGHFYCRECITTVLKRNFRAACPLCMKPYTKRSIQEASQRKSICTALRSAVDTIETLLGIDIISAPTKLALIPKSQEKTYPEDVERDSETQITNDDPVKTGAVSKNDSLKENLGIASDMGTNTSLEDFCCSKPENEKNTNSEKKLNSFNASRNKLQKSSQEKNIHDSGRKKSRKIPVSQNSPNVFKNDGIGRYFSSHHITSSIDTENSSSNHSININKSKFNDLQEYGNDESVERPTTAHMSPVEAVVNCASKIIQNEHRARASLSKLSKSKGKKLPHWQESKMLEIDLPKNESGNILNHTIMIADSQDYHDVINANVVQSVTNLEQNTVLSNEEKNDPASKSAKCQDDVSHPLEHYLPQDQEMQSPLSDESTDVDQQNEQSQDLINTPLHCRSPGWSRIKQMNQDFHLKTFPLLHIRKNIPLQSHSRVKATEEHGKSVADALDVHPQNVAPLEEIESCAPSGNESNMHNFDIHEENNDIDGLASKLNSTPKPIVNASDNNKNIFSQDVESLKRICTNYIASHLYNRGFERYKKEGSAVPEKDIPKLVNTATNSSDISNFQLPIEIDSYKSIAKRLSDVTPDLPSMSNRKKMRISRNSSSDDAVLLPDSRYPSPDKEKCPILDPKFKLTSENSVLDTSDIPSHIKTKLDSTKKSHEKIKQHKTIKQREGFHHTKTTKPKSYVPDKGCSDVSSRTKVVKRVCFTLEEIFFHFKKFNTSGETQVISSVPLPFSEFHLQLDVTDQTLNISVLKNLKSNHAVGTAASGDSLSLSSSEGYEAGQRNHIYSRTSYETPPSSKSGKNNNSRLIQNNMFSDTESEVKSLTSAANSSHRKSNYRNSTSISSKQSNKTPSSNKKDTHMNFSTEKLHNSYDAVAEANDNFDTSKDNVIDHNVTPMSFTTQTLGSHSPAADKGRMQNVTPKAVTANEKVQKRKVSLLAENQLSPVTEKNKQSYEYEDKAMEVSEGHENVTISEKAKSAYVDTKSPCKQSMCANSNADLQKPCERPNLSPIPNIKKTSDSLGEDMLSEDIDPFADSCEPANCAAVPFSVFDELLQESDGYASDPDMLFANDLVAPLRDMAKKLPQTDSLNKSANITNKSFSKKNKFKRITTMSSSDDSDSSDQPTQPFLVRGKFPPQKVPVVCTSKNVSLLSNVGTEDCLTFTQDANTGEVDQMRLEIERMNARIMELEKEITEDNIGVSDESDSEMVKPTNSQERPRNSRNVAEEIHSDDSKESSELFTELIPPTPPAHH